MGDHHDGLAVVVHAAPQESEHLRAAAGVEVARWFIGENDRGPAGHRAGTRHTLLLATGQLAGLVIQARTQPHGVDDGVEPLLIGFCPGDVQRKSDVLLGVERRDEVEALEHESDLIAPKGGQFLVFQRGQVNVAHGHRAFGDRVEAGQAVHQCGFTRPRRTHDGGEVPLLDIDVDVVEGHHSGLTLAVHLGEAAGRGGGCCGRSHPSTVSDVATLGWSGSGGGVPPNSGHRA